MSRRILTSLVLALGLMSSIHAATLTGRVTDTSGVGLFLADIDLIDPGSGDDVVIFNDQTDASGFFTATVPSGTYHIVINGPSGTRYVPVRLDNTTIGTSLDIGPIALELGFFLSGQVQNQAGAGVMDVDLDVERSLTGANIFIRGGGTDATGNFSVLVPPGTLDIFFDPSDVDLQTLAAEVVREVVVTSDRSLGVVQLRNGFVVSGTVRGPGGTPVNNADIDVDDAVTGERRYTPNDNTNSLGQFSVVLPLGTFDITAEPPFVNHLVAATQFGVIVNGPTSVPLFSLQTGVVMDVVVRAANGAPIAGCDIEIRRNGQEVVTPGDDTDVTGHAQIIVPTGTLSFEIVPPLGSSLQGGILPSLEVQGDQPVRVRYRANGSPILFAPQL